MTLKYTGFTFAVFILFIQGCFAQLPDNLLKYYRLVNNAELSIVDSNYTGAIELYDSAFATEPKVEFMKDVYNQAICEILIGNYDTAYLNLQNLIEFGYPIDSIIARQVFYPFFDSRFGRKLMRHNQKSIETYNIDLRDTYDSLLIMDQKFRSMEGSYDVYGDTIQKIDISNAEKVTKLLNLYGFPSEQLIGVYVHFDYTPMRILILHNNIGSRNGQHMNFTKIIYKAIYSGKIDSRLCPQLLMGSTGNDYFGFEYSGVIRHGMESEYQLGNLDSLYTDWGYYKLDSELEEELNERREKIGVCTINDTRVKALFNMRDKRFYLAEPANKRNTLWLYREDYINAMNNTIFIK